MICWRVGRRAGADALSFRTSCSSVGRVRGGGSSQTRWGRLQWIAPASANKVQRLGPRPEKTTFGTLYQVLMTGLKLWLIYPLILSVILAMIANFFHQMHLCLYFVFCALHSLFTNTTTHQFQMPSRTIVFLQSWKGMSVSIVIDEVSSIGRFMHHIQSIKSFCSLLSSHCICIA